jgi:MFS family permease
MQDALHIDAVGWSWITGVFVFSYGVFEIPSGAMGDRIGPRRVLTRIVLWWSAFTALTGAASNYYLLLLTRFCFGMGEAGAYPNATVAISRWFPARRRAAAYGTVALSSQLGGAISPLLVVPIQSRYGWRAPFYVFGILGVVWGIVWYAWFRDSPAEKSGLSKQELDETRGIVVQSGHRLRLREALRSSNLLSLMGVGACYYYTLYFYQSWLHTYLMKRRGFSEHDLLLSSLPYVVGAIANLCGGIASDGLARRFGLTWGRRMVGIAGLGAATLACLAVMLSGQRAWALIWLSLLYGSITFQQPNTFAVCMDIGGNSAGAVTGAMNTAAQIGGLLSTFMFGYLLRIFGSYDVPFVPMTLLLGAGALLWLRIDAARELLPRKQSIAEAAGAV